MGGSPPPPPPPDAAAVCGAPPSPSKPSSRTEVRHALGSPSISGTGETLADSGSTGELLVLRAGHLEDALDAALSVASAGDVVLLSPACASFDEFGSFEERGRAFKALVDARAQRAGK